MSREADAGRRALCAPGSSARHQTPRTELAPQLQSGGKPMATSEKVVYTSRVRIERQKGPMRLAYLPAEEEPLHFGVHSEIAEHYKVSPDAYPSRAATLDYVVAATGG
jgi:hypothetical protein